MIYIMGLREERSLGSNSQAIGKITDTSDYKSRKLLPKIRTQRKDTEFTIDEEGNKSIFKNDYFNI
jgi:hypothetical protein